MNNDKMFFWLDPKESPHRRIAGQAPEHALKMNDSMFFCLDTKEPKNQG